MTLDYSEGWPRVENLDARRPNFATKGMSAHLSGGAHRRHRSLESGDARFADFKNGELEIHVGARGDAADALAFLRATPLDAIAEHAFSSVEASGPLQSTVDLFLPFKDFDASAGAGAWPPGRRDASIEPGSTIDGHRC